MVLVDGVDFVFGNDGGVVREVNECGLCVMGLNNFFVLFGFIFCILCSFVGLNSILFVDDLEVL